jgi:putative colanic acid biosynthesis glycosyltransferase
MKFFSIITICKNNFIELKKTNNSIISQTNNNYEWIVIDGNSKDNTQKWLKSNHLANWISETDNGIYDAMNKGILMAKGKYLIFMNSGDCFDCNSVLSNSQVIIEQQKFPAFVYGDSVDISENGSSYYRKAKNHKKNWKGMITQHQAMFFNREKLGNLKYLEDYELSGDYAFISSFLNNLNKNDILYLNFSICKFSMGGLNETKRFKALKEDYKIRKEIINLPMYSNLTLYFLHYIHATIKKSYPSFRFIKHKPVN